MGKKLFSFVSVDIVNIYLLGFYHNLFKIAEGSFYVSFSKKEVRPDAPQNGLQSTFLSLLVCVQTLSPSPREDATKWAYSLFLLQD